MKTMQTLILTMCVVMIATVAPSLAAETGGFAHGTLAFYLLLNLVLVSFLGLVTTIFFSLWRDRKRQARARSVDHDNRQQGSRSTGQPFPAARQSRGRKWPQRERRVS